MNACKIRWWLTIWAVAFGGTAWADRAARLASRVDAVLCADLFTPGAPDYTRRATRVGRTPLAWIRYWGDRAQTRHDRRAWRVTQNRIAERWDQFYAGEIAGADWTGDYARARDRLDARARLWITTESRNPGEIVAGFIRFQNAMRDLKADNAEVAARERAAPARRLRELRVGDGAAAVADALARVTPTGSPRPPADFGRRLRLDRRLRRLIAGEVQVLRRVPADQGRRRLAVTFAMLAHGIEPDDIRATRRALVGLRPGGAAARAEVMDEVARVPLLNRVIRRTAGPDGRLARWAYLIYLAHRLPHRLPNPADAPTLIRVGKAVTAEQDSQDVEQVITDVIMTTGESPALRAALAAAFTVLPQLMDPDAAAAHPELPGDEVLDSYSKGTSFKP